MLQALLNKLILPAVVLSVLALSGCEKEFVDPPAGTGTLSGTIKSKGEICGNCVMSVYNHETLFRRGARVGESGSYELKEIPFGDYRLKVFQTPSNDPDVAFDKRIPKKYRDFKTSGVKVSVPSAEPVVLDIDME